MRVLIFICLAAYVFAGCRVRFADTYYQRLDPWVDTIGYIKNNAFLNRFFGKEKSLVIKHKMAGRNRIEVYIANFGTATHFVSRIDAQADLSTEIKVHGKWIDFQDHGRVFCGNSFWVMPMKPGDYLKCHIAVPGGIVPYMYRIKSRKGLDSNFQTVEDSAVLQPFTVFLSPEALHYATKHGSELEKGSRLKKPEPDFFKIRFCGKKNAGTISYKDLANADSFSLGTVPFYYKGPKALKIRYFTFAVVYKDTLIRSFVESGAGNHLSPNMKNALIDPESISLIIIGDVEVKYGDRYVNLPGATYKVK